MSADISWKLLLKKLTHVHTYWKCFRANTFAQEMKERSERIHWVASDNVDACIGQMDVASDGKPYLRRHTTDASDAEQTGIRRRAIASNVNWSLSISGINSSKVGMCKHRTRRCNCSSVGSHCSLCWRSHQMLCLYQMQGIERMLCSLGISGCSLECIRH